MSSNDAAELCRACGLCCDGTFFRRVPLEPAEPERLERHSLPIVGRSMSLPCPRRDASGCSIYDDRPARCASYRCRLLAELEGGARRLDEALAKVGQLRALREQIRAHLSSDDPSGLDLHRAAESIFDASGAIDPSWRVEKPEALLDMVTFLRLCRRDFGVGETKGDDAGQPLTAS